MPATLKGVIFDYGVLFQRDAQVLAEIRELLQGLNARGLRVVVFSTHYQDFAAEFATRNLPPPDHIVTRADAGANKGAKAWVREAAARCGVCPHELMYVGDDRQDWLTAINSATFYLHASWSAPQAAGTTCLCIDRPGEVLRFATHFLLPANRWAFMLDLPDEGISVRCLLPSGTSLPATRPSSFKLQDVFTWETEVAVGQNSASTLLGLHAISSLYCEGLVGPNFFYTVYPSSTPGKINPILERFVEPASSLFHGYFRRELLVRGAQAPDTSLERYHARIEGRTPNVGFTTQANSVHLNPAQADGLRGRTVVVFDDFTSYGLSLDWARLLLRRAGAQRVMLVTMGKYGSQYRRHSPAPATIIEPFALNAYAEGEFAVCRHNLEADQQAEALVQRSLARWRECEPLDA